MNRRLSLLTVYQTDPIPVERIAPDLFGLSYAKARAKIADGSFPLPAFQLADSQKAPWLVSVDALATYIEQREKEAKTRSDLLPHLLQGSRDRSNAAP